jgi:cation:H+ antiporter
LCALPADKFVLTRQGWVQFGSAVLLAGLCYFDFYLNGDEAALGRWVGLFFLALLAWYLAMSVRWSRGHARQSPGGEASEPSVDPVVNDETESSIRSDLTVWQLLGLGLAGLAIVLLGGEALVQSAGRLAIEWGVPSQVVAATLIAFGTSLPELMVAVTSIRKGHPELLVGNVVGADILNVLFVIGAAAVAAPLQIVENGDRIFLYLHLPTLLLILVLFRGYIFKAIRGEGFSRWMGTPLLVIYVSYVVLQYALSSGQPTLAAP